MDNDVTWYNAAKDIADFLIASNRDRYGWYANGVPGDGDEGESDDDPTAVAGTWADDRGGSTRPADAKARLITQAAAAAACLSSPISTRSRTAADAVGSHAGGSGHGSFLSSGYKQSRDRKHRQQLRDITGTLALKRRLACCHDISGA